MADMRALADRVREANAALEAAHAAKIAAMEAQFEADQRWRSAQKDVVEAVRALVEAAAGSPHVYRGVMECLTSR